MKQDPFKPNIWRGQIFWSQICYSREFHTVNVIVTDLSNTYILLLVNKKYTTENKDVLGIYVVVNLVTLRPKDMIQMFVTYGELVSIFWGVWVSRTLQICSSGLNRPKKTERKKLKKDRKQREKQNFLAFVDFVRSRNKVLSKAIACFWLPIFFVISRYAW